MITNDLRDSVQRWLFHDCLPFWAEHGPDRVYGGFIEDLNFNGSDTAREFKRTRVTCRQVYVFSHASLLGWDQGADLIADGVDYLTTRAWMEDRQAFARRLTRQGEVLDPTIDLYDHAFALFAFSWAFRATKNSSYLDWARRTLDSIEHHLRAPPSQGFWHQYPVEGWRQQNPHMHLLEAALAAYEFSGDEVFKAVAIEISELFKSRFFDSADGVLAEFFKEDWTLADGDAGMLAEPGHHFEWAWILRRCETILGASISGTIRALVRFGERYGVDPESHAVRNSVSRSGIILDGGSRTWPNTERIKAGVALVEMGDSLGEKLISQSASLLLSRYLAPAKTINIPSGSWVDAFDEEGAPCATLSPPSTLYHIFMAFAEMLRIQATVSGESS